MEALRRLHSSRIRGRAIPLTVTLHDPDGRSWILGPAADAPPLGPLPAAQAARILQAALDEPNATAARARLLQTRVALETAEVAGLDPQGLFATHELTYGVPRRDDWVLASERARAILSGHPRGNELVRALGFASRQVPGNALLLTVGDEPPRAVAILLRDDEAFDAESARFAKSPIYHGLEIAAKNRVPWLVVMRGAQVRLYPTSPDVGVGRRGVTQTYFGLDLALLDDDHAAYLDLTFSARALAPGGSVDQLLASSQDYAVALGERLRDRVYTKVVDPLSTAVARALQREGPLDEGHLAQAYRLSLRILFRLLFQAYAEDTRLLPLHRNERYTAQSLKELARDLAAHPERPNDPNSASMWDGLIRVWRVIDTGDAAWGVPAYNGGLFGSDPTLHPDGAATERLALANDVMGPVLAGLLVDQTEGRWLGPIDFRSLDVRDFGTIYEGLLESGLSVADENLTEDANGAWRPTKPGEAVDVVAGDPYFHTKSGERKATGSYFTKPFVVEHLLSGALDPAIDEHLEKIRVLLDRGDQSEAAERFFDLRVADLAMGSGHFLVAAIGHIEAKFGAFLETQSVPGVERELITLAAAAQEVTGRVGVEAEIDRSALLSRQIARRCVYGMDVNEIAVELARLAIWIRTFVPGLPMSSLDHQLVWGDSLTGIGTVEEAVTTLDPDARQGTLTFTGAAISSALEEARSVLEDAAASKEANRAETMAAQEAARHAMEAAEPARLLFDAAIAFRLGLLDLPSDFDAASVSKRAAGPEVQAAIGELNAIHFPFHFPEVFLRPAAGFDVLVGNPPWEKVKVEADKWWGARLPGLFTLPVGARDEAIEQAKHERPDLARAYEVELRRTDRLREILRRGPYPGLGTGDIDLYKAFAWRMWDLAARGSGRVGFVCPRSLVSEAGTAEWRERAFDEGEFSEVTLLLNTARWAFDMEPRYSIALVSAAVLGKPGEHISLRGPYPSQAAFDSGVAEEPAVFTAQEFRTWGSGAAFPILGSADDGDVYLQMRHHPRLDADVGSWRARPYAEFHATADKPLFQLDSVPDGWWPLYKGESFDLWEPDRTVYYGAVDPAVVLPLLQQKRLRSSRLANSPFSEFPREVIEDDRTLPIRHPRIALRLVTRATDSRTVRCALVPPNVGLTHGAPYLLFPRGSQRDQAYLLGILSSIPLDWMARRTVEVNLTYHVLNGFAVPRPEPNDPQYARLVEITARLASPDDRYERWARDVGVGVGSVSGTECDELLAELDALSALLYGLSEAQVKHVFATFHRGWSYEPRLARVLEHFANWSDG
jgi:hypothetical protein